MNNISIYLVRLIQNHLKLIVCVIYCEVSFYGGERMKIVSIINQKGGSGKTTLALHLAVALSAAGRNTAVVDLDPQATAANWGDRREATAPVVRSAHASRLAHEIQQIEGAGGEALIIDTAPHSDSAAVAAAYVSDLILIPCRPAYFDLEAMANTLKFLRATGKPLWAVLNAVTAFGSEAEEAASTIRALELRLCPAQLGRRIAFSRAVSSGLRPRSTNRTARRLKKCSGYTGWYQRRCKRH